MPIVPRYDALQVGQSSAPVNLISTPKISGVSAPSAPADHAGFQAQQLGQGMQQFGGDIGRIAADMAQQANQLRVDDAVNQAREASLRLTYDKDAGFASLKGLRALERPGGKPLAEEYGERLNEHLSRISGTLGNEAQKQAFALRSNDLLTSFRGQATQHEASEFKNYSLSVSEGIQLTALREIGLNWQNPDTVNSAVERVRAETYRQAQLLGKSAEWQDAQARKLTSNAHKVALLSALEQNDPSYADAYLKKYSAQMDADDILSVRGHITKEMAAQTSQAAALQAAREMAPRFAGGSESDRAFHVAVGAESGYRQFNRDGTPKTSKAGAIGIAQVMPGTGPEAAKLAGMPWDEQRYRTEPEYNYAIGKAYFDEQLRVFGGDVEKAWAAYNAGPGALREALKKADRLEMLAKNDPNIAPVHWLAFLPQETRDYVAKNSKAFAAGSARPQAPTELEFVQSAIGRLPAGATAQQVALTQTQAERQYALLDKDRKQRENEGFLSAQEALVRNGGNLAALPASIRDAVPASRQDDLLTFAGKIGKGVPIETDWNLYSQLRAMAATQPEQFGGTDLRLYYGKLAPTQREQLLDLQTGINDPGKRPDVATLAQQLSTAHHQLGLKANDLEKKGKFDDAVTQALASEMRNRKRELTFEERDQVIKRMMLPTSGGWFSSPRLYEAAGTPGEAKAKPAMTSDERALIVATLTGRGLEASEANIVALFKKRYGLN